MNLTTINFLEHHIRHTPDAPATSDGNTKRTWKELGDRVARLASGLVSAGLQPGNRIAILSANSDDYYESLLAVWWAGGIVNPVNTRWSPTEIAYSLDDSDTQMLIIDQDFSPLLTDIRALSASLRTVIAVGQENADVALCCESMIERCSPLEPVAVLPGDVAGIFYTGGTTGFPKGVTVTQQSIVANTYINLLEMPMEPSDVVLAVSPMFHLAGMCLVIRALVRGAALSFLPSFEEEAVINTMEKDGVTYTLLVPVMIQRLLDAGTNLSARLRSLRFIQYGASPINETLLRRLIKDLPHVSLAQGYGMTETSGPYTILPAEVHRNPDGPHAARLRSAGRPAAGVQLRVIREDGNTAAIGEVGEIVCRGPIVMQGYWNKPDLTAAALQGGWLHSGDMGYLDEGGFLFIVDRLKDMIVSGGENVYSAEVENALAKHPAVSACAVIAVPSERWGEQVHAVVVPKAGFSPGFEDLRNHCKTLIAGYKCPVSVDFVTELPYTSAGKLQKNVLRERYWKAQSRCVG
jgi:long-chain acyl-CoA synthetase